MDQLVNNFKKLIEKLGKGFKTEILIPGVKGKTLFDDNAIAIHKEALIRGDLDSDFEIYLKEKTRRKRKWESIDDHEVSVYFQAYLRMKVTN